MPAYLYILIIPLLPLVSFAVLGLWGRRHFSTSAGIIGTATVSCSTILAITAAAQYFFSDGKQNGVYQKLVVIKYTWLTFTPGLSIDMGVLLDPISVMMIMIVSFISLMVHVFSLAYMKGEERFATYYAFLSLFTFSMLGLVLSSNIFQTYIFWELVGLSSFLLIGFYYDKPSAVSASKKAFIVTRFADLGFLIGILILAFYTGTLDFGELIVKLSSSAAPEYIALAGASFLGASMLTWALALIFVGGAGKSAMFPLHIWLPDAMEGPTPVSALIHAATMVVAGVYLVARLFPVFVMDSYVLRLITWVGLSSAIIAAVIACTQTDIKRILAYSTMSQIGYMMFALGVSGYGGQQGLGFSASMFHLFTHAFFKSLLFLCAGVIIHFVRSNEFKDMGGLRKYLPLTHLCFLVGCLAIAGLPPFAGFFSKEEILIAAFRSNRFVYAIALLTAGLTAFYMFRLYFRIFWNRDSQHVISTHGKTPLAMKGPLVILAICSITAGFVPFAGFVTSDGQPLHTEVDLLFSTLPVVMVLLAIFLAGLLYRKENDKPQKIASAAGSIYTAFSHKLYIDEIYLFITRKVVFNLVGRPAAWFDKHIIDGLVNGAAVVTAGASALIKGLQSGKVQSYTLYFFTGMAALAILFIYVWK